MIRLYNLFVDTGIKHGFKSRGNSKLVSALAQKFLTVVMVEVPFQVTNYFSQIHLVVHSTTEQVLSSKGEY